MTGDYVAADVYSTAFHLTKPLSEVGVVPLRKELKDAAKSARLKGHAPAPKAVDVLDDWELTVGIEIHAQLNSATKLFSPAIPSPFLPPNTGVAQFDIALPGSQPVLQHAVLLPALRAAIALNCDVQLVSTFDRKHYFYHDQPAGYQITQYYQPLARNGHLTLNTENDTEPLKVRIKQIQLEQDTAKSQELDEETTLIDFNRSGQALIEIISMPDIHSPTDASAYVRKVQGLLRAVDAVTIGMEEGGLRADVNVSVRHRHSTDDAGHSYAGVQDLGQRTEIKNLSSLAGIEHAIRAERDRQIAVLTAGGAVEAETRGWSVTNPHETRRLRGKEGEVDYRYMPDPDIPPLYLHAGLIDTLERTLPPSPEKLRTMVMERYDISPSDLNALLTLDDGERLIYFQTAVRELSHLYRRTVPTEILGKYVLKWVLHELGALLSTEEVQWSPVDVLAPDLAQILYHLEQGKITHPSAKLILKLKFNGDKRHVIKIIEEDGLAFVSLSTVQYEKIAQEVIDKHPQIIKDIQEHGKLGKIQFLMGKLLSHPDKGKMQPKEAEKVLRRLILGEE
ncbi:hypothetical protein B0A52_07716 [Exophiala mesophila]|uniref:Glutamyl-tRNA(Gln) amidotransferase subunit B, mitochondrial n=1 Tax=Exophiala mesophila TaxID=212818 RepID=A0A438MVM1_EXOME|nr:hypothetical protein B0A52_07716 [Exophiala mesophila]